MEPNLTVTSNAGFKQILLKKLSCAVIASITSQILLLFIFLFIINLDILHPWQLKNFFNIFTSLYMWIYIIPFTTIIFAHSIICAKDYVLVSDYSSSRFSKFISIFSLHNFILLALHVISGGLVVWLYLALSGGKYAEFTKKCSMGEDCLVEGKLYLILAGLWSGLYYFMNMYRSDKKIKFPVVHQYKLLQFKTQLIPVIQKCKSDALWPTVYFTILYYFLGAPIKNFISKTFIIKIENESSIFIYLYCWIFISLYFIKLRLMSLFFELFLTEPVYFPVESIQKDDLILANALAVQKIPIVQHLACYDLYMLSYWCPNRRSQVYAVSQPGGHPHNWNLLTINLLKIIADYSQELNKSTNTILEPERKTLQQTNKANTILMPERSALNVTETVRNSTMRNMSYREPEPLDIVNVTHGHLTKTFDYDNKTIANKIAEKSKYYVESFKQKLGINFIFGELPEGNIQQCLANGQIIIWTCQGLATLVMFALEEDTYGVVQKDIPVIISTLYELKMSLEKLNRLPALSKRGSDDFNYKMKVTLNSAVKRSIFNICKAYWPYLKDLNLKKDVYQYISSVSNSRT